MEVIDSPVERYLKVIDSGTRQGFGKVKKEIRELQSKTDKLDSALKLQEQLRDLRKRCDNFVEDSRFRKEMDRLKLNDSAAEKAVKLVEEIEKLKSEIKKFKTADEVDAKTKEIWEIMSTLEVKKIDIAKLDTQIAKVKKEIELQAMNEKKLENLNQDVIDLKKTALTSYKFNKLQSYIEEIDRDVQKLVCLHEYVRNLANKDDIKDLRKIFDVHSSATDKLASAFEKSAGNHIRIKNNEIESNNLREMIKAVHRNIERMGKRFNAIEKAIEKISSGSANIKQITFKKVSLENPSKAGKEKRKSGKKASDEFYNWLVQEKKE